jgi:hypothetical protein
LAELACYISVLVNYMRHERSPSMVRSPLCDFLIKTAIGPFAKVAMPTLPPKSDPTLPTLPTLMTTPTSSPHFLDALPSSTPPQPLSLTLSSSPSPSITGPCVLLSPAGGIEGVSTPTTPAPLSIIAPSSMASPLPRLPSIQPLSIGVPSALSTPKISTMTTPPVLSRPTSTPVSTPSLAPTPSSTIAATSSSEALMDAHLRFCYDLYWALSVAAESKTHKRDYDHVKERLVRELTAADPLLAQQLSDGQDFVARFERSPVREIDGLRAGLKTVVFPLRLPVDPSVRVLSMNLEGVKEFDSATRPVMVPCQRDLSKAEWLALNNPTPSTNATTTTTPPSATVASPDCSPATIAMPPTPAPAAAPRSPTMTPRPIPSTPPQVRDVLGDANAIATVASLMSPSTTGPRHEIKYVQHHHHTPGHHHHHHGHHPHPYQGTGGHHPRQPSLAHVQTRPKPESAPPSLYRIIYKREDVRKDQIILNVIRMMDTILKRDAGLDLLAVTYRVTPTSSIGGFLEMVLNCETVSNIRGPEGKKPLVNWLAQFENNNHIIFGTFSRSMAFWTVVQLLLGLGDRHLDNIMLTHDGRLFHIDFGFVLGQEPKPMMPRIRLDSFMIEAMGGEENPHYASYLDMCIRAFLCLRQHMSLFYQMLLSLPEVLSQLVVHAY